MTAMRVRYIEPIGSDLHCERSRAVLAAAAPAGVDVEVTHLSLPPELAGAMLPPVPLYLNAIVAEVLRAEADGCDAAIIGCCTDPALPEAQRASRMPVIGPLQAAVAVALGRGHRLAILYPDEHAWRVTANWARRNLRTYGAPEVVGPIEFVPMHVDGEDSLIGATEVSAAEVQGRFRRQLHGPGVAAARALLARDPADAILFGCTLWGGMVAEIADDVDAVCLDPVITALHVAVAQASVLRAPAVTPAAV
jgi:allantoin racemase